MHHYGEHPFATQDRDVLFRRSTLILHCKGFAQQKNANPRSGAHFFVAAEAKLEMRTAPQNAFIRSSVLKSPKERHMVRAERVGARLFAA